MDNLSLILAILIFIVIVLIAIKIFTNKDNVTQQALLQELLRLSDGNKDHLFNQFNSLTDRIDSKINDLTTRNTQFERAISQHIIQFQEKLSKSTESQSLKLQELVEKRLSAIDHRVMTNLETGFNKTNETFTNIVERLSKIDEAQKKIDSLSSHITSLQDVLTDKKTRGTFGEVQLSQIMKSVFGEKNDSIYQMQYTFNTGVRADAVLFAPEPLGTIAIDSKFPLENYRKMVDMQLSEVDRSIATKQFKLDCKKHIDDISSKYIIEGTTSNQAVMFIPAEAIFATINAYHQDIIDYSQSCRVWLASPTTLMSTLTTIQSILVNLEREKYAAVIHEQLRQLSVEFDRYKDRWESLSRKMDGVSDEFRKINITTEKITKRFNSISQVDKSALEQDINSQD